MPAMAPHLPVERPRPQSVSLRVMKYYLTLSVILGAVLCCDLAQSQSQPTAPDARAAASSPEKPLFLHLLAPGAITNPAIPALRIVTARVYPSQPFSVSIGDPEDPFATPWDGAVTIPRLSTNGSWEARPLGRLWNSGDAALAGRIDQVNGRFFARLQGLNRKTLSYFDGEIELENPVYGHGTYLHGNTVYGVWFALSADANSRRFLKALDEGSLQIPGLVDQNSPEANQWTRGNPNAKTNGPAKVRQPIPSETNSTPSAAGPTR